MLEIILIFLGFMVVVSMPLLFMYLFSSRDWHFKKLNPKQLEEKSQEDLKSWRLFGFFLIILSLGVNLFNVGFANLPLWLRGIIFVFGVMLVYASYKNPKIKLYG